MKFYLTKSIITILVRLISLLYWNPLSRRICSSPRSNESATVSTGGLGDGIWEAGLVEGKHGPGQMLRQRRKIGILLSNLGTPDATDYWSMRRYLSEFLSDRRVIEVPRLLWFFILHGLILMTRPARKGQDYATIWNRERNESPLKTFTRAQAEKLRASIAQGLLGESSAEVIVDWGMRYGNPRARQTQCQRH